jgi:hypothetical protein
MGWCTTSDLDQFTAAAGGYLRTRAAENTLLLSAVYAAGASGRTRAANGHDAGATAPGLLFGWWEPPDGGPPRGAFLHDPAAPLLMSSSVPEIAAALAATLTKMNRQVYGVDAPSDAADAFAAAWSQRAGTIAKVHRHCNIYRVASPGLAGPGMPGPAGRLRVAAVDDFALLAGWLAAFAAETAERIGSPTELAAELIGYGGAALWEVPQRPPRLRDAAQFLVIPHRREAAASGEAAYQPVALAALTRPVAGSVRITMVYTPQERRRSGYAAAATRAVSRALLASPVPGAPGAPGEPGAPGLLGGPAVRGRVTEVVMITDSNRPDRWGSRLGYQLVSERTVLRFGPMTGPLPRLPGAGRAPRLPTGPLPRLPRLRH